MSNNLNPIIPPPTQAIEIDSFIYNLQLLLSTHLTWLSNDYGRVYRFLEEADQKLYLPNIYIGNNNYVSAHPDDNKQGQCFFVAENESIDFNGNLLRYNVGIVFQVNLDLINQPLAANELFTQNLIAQAREIINDFGVGATGVNSIELKSITRNPTEVYKEFTFNKTSNNYNVAPLQCFRINLVVEMPPACDFNFDFAQALINHISENELLSILLPTIDFSKPNAISNLSGQQIIDLKTALC